MTTLSPVAHSRAATISAVIDYVRCVEGILARQLPDTTVAVTGPRYQTLKVALVDLRRVFQFCEATFRDKRADDPESVVNCLIALAGQALKTADDVAAAARLPLGRASVNVETTLAVLVDD